MYDFAGREAAGSQPFQPRFNLVYLGMFHNSFLQLNLKGWMEDEKSYLNSSASAHYERFWNTQLLLKSDPDKNGLLVLSIQAIYGNDTAGLQPTHHKKQKKLGNHWHLKNKKNVHCIPLLGCNKLAVNLQKSWDELMFSQWVAMPARSRTSIFGTCFTTSWTSILGTCRTTWRLRQQAPMDRKDKSLTSR